MQHRKAPLASKCWPRCWLMCDARLGEHMPAIIAAIPPRSAIVVRPYAMESRDLTQMIRAIRRAARAKHHLLLLAGPGSLSGYDGRHGTAHKGKRAPFTSAPVHNAAEARRARSRQVDVVLVSPLWPTRSHVDVKGIGHARFQQLARQSRCPAIALGGMDAARFRLARRHGAYGWAAIDAWQIKQG